MHKTDECQNDGENIVASGTVSVSSGCGVMEQWVGVGCTIMPAVT